MKKLSTWLIILGIIICLIPVGGRLYMKYEQNKLYEEYLASLEVENTALTEVFDSEVTSEVAIEAPPSPPPAKIENVIGRISIPSISSNQLLLEGSDAKPLRYGAGHVTGTALPGELGNCSIAAHRNYTFGSYFNRLGEVVLNDTISIEYNDSTFNYIVTEIFVVEPSDVSVLVNTPESATVTLITCHPKGSNTQRLIVKGILQ